METKAAAAYNEGYLAGFKPFYTAIQGPHKTFSDPDEQASFNKGFQKGLVDYGFKHNLSD